MKRILSSGIATTIAAIIGDDLCRVDMAAGLFGPMGYRLACGYASFGRFGSSTLARFGDFRPGQFGGFSLLPRLGLPIRRSRSHWFYHPGTLFRQHFVVLH